MNPIGATITFKGTPSVKYLNRWRTRQAGSVPKRDLVFNLALMIQNGELKVLSSLPLAQVLATEMQNMTVKIDSQTGNDSYSTGRESDHDDLTLALCLAAWWSKNKTAPTVPTKAYRA